MNKDERFYRFMPKEKKKPDNSIPFVFLGLQSTTVLKKKEGMKKKIKIKFWFLISRWARAPASERSRNRYSTSTCTTVVTWAPTCRRILYAPLACGNTAARVALVMVMPS